MFRPSYRGGSFRRKNQFRTSYPKGISKNTRTNESKYIKKAVETTEQSVFVPSISFNDLDINPILKKNIAERGYVSPTPIQEKAIPQVLKGGDVIGIANTGTGKTAAFLIPLLHKAMNNRQEKILIVIPTRELAMQIREELFSLTNGTNINASLLIGGSNMRTQIYELQRSPQFVIGTPGRIKDLIERKILNIAQFQTIVLDEVDRMLDMGFIQDIRYLISLLPPQRQSLFFSATLSNEINALINQFVKEPFTISVKTQETTGNVEQDIVRIKFGEQKIEILEQLLNKEEFKKILIFGRTKRGVENLSRNLYQKGFKVTSIHGDKPQFQRNKAIRLFELSKVDILVATDVASRGIDINDISHVINYDEPATYDDYVHRIGRTGRANKKGVALTFVGP